MELKDLQSHWDTWGKTDPFWAILSDPAKRGGKWGDAEFFRTGEEWIAHVMRYVDSLGVSLGRKNALDFGCGAGRLTQPLCRYFEQSCGVDIAESMIELANQFNRHGDRCRYYLNQSDDLELFGDDVFDFIYTFVVLQHMHPEYSKNYIREFMRVLAPGGLLIFQIPGELIPVAAQSGATASQSVITSPLPDAAYKAQMAMLNCPRSLRVGSQLILRVQIQNVSDLVWPALGAADGRCQIKLGNRWMDTQGKMISASDGLTLLPYDLRAMDQVELPLLITAPNTPGRYILEVNIMQEGAGWFSDRGSQTHRGVVEIVAISSGEAEGFTSEIEMHGVPRPVIVELVEKHGGKIVDIREDRAAGEHFVSLTYCVTKPHASTVR